MRRSANFSECRGYRYSLWRDWSGKPEVEFEPYVAFIGLNPSTADETVDDPTIRRCIGFARSWGFGRLVMLNLFAIRATDPRNMLAAREPIGPRNDEVIRNLTPRAALLIAAWGTKGAHLSRDRDVARITMRALACLGVTKGGHPRHPLYVRGDTKPEPFSFENDRMAEALRESNTMLEQAVADSYDDDEDKAIIHGQVARNRAALEEGRT